MSLTLGAIALPICQYGGISSSGEDFFGFFLGGESRGERPCAMELFFYETHIIQGTIIGT